MKKKIRLGFIGGGYNSLIGVLHKVSAYMHDRYEILGGVFNSKYDDSLERYNNIDALLNSLSD